MKGYGKDIFNVKVVVRLGKEQATKIAELLTVKTCLIQVQEVLQQHL